MERRDGRSSSGASLIWNGHGCRYGTKVNIEKVRLMARRVR